MRRASVFVTTAIFLLLTVPLSAAADEALHYQLPPGWVDLLDPATDTTHIPAAPLSEARTGKYAVYAIDPANLSTVGANASMNVIELPSTGAVTMAMMRATAASSATQAQGMGLEMDIQDVKVLKLGGVDIGRIDSMFGSSAGMMRLQQYIIPGATKSATITYACRPDELDRYQSIFEASAMATRGAHRSGFDFGRIFKMGLIGAVVGGLSALIVALLAAKRRGGAKTAAVPLQQASTLWDCPVCKRRVPMRVDACRCGAMRPA